MTEPVAPPAADPPGWYCFSTQPRLAEWDGVAWTGTTHAAVAGPVLPGPPRAFAFVRQRWFRWVVLGQVLVVLPALWSGATGNAWWSWISVVGYVAFLAGGVMVVSRHLDLGEVDGMRALTWIGIGSGVVAFGIGFGLEVLAEHVAGWATTLWLTGPIEEGGKLLVPFLLLVFGAPRFRVPRIGLYLVLVSGATVGVLEGVEYEGRPGFAWAHLQMALVRPSAELLHVFVTGFAAAVIWLAAWRRKRPVTPAGVVAFLIAAGIHSFHDGIVTFFNVQPHSFDASLAQTLRQAIDRGLAGGALALGLAALLYLLVRHGRARNSPPPRTSPPVTPDGDRRSRRGGAILGPRPARPTRGRRPGCPRYRPRLRLRLRLRRRTGRPLRRPPPCRPTRRQLPCRPTRRPPGSGPPAARRRAGDRSPRRGPGPGAARCGADGLRAAVDAPAGGTAGLVRRRRRPGSAGLVERHRLGPDQPLGRQPVDTRLSPGPDPDHGATPGGRGATRVRAGSTRTCCSHRGRRRGNLA